MDKKNYQNIVVVGKVVSTGTTTMDEVRRFPQSQLSAEDVAPLRLTEDEVARIVIKQN